MSVHRIYKFKIKNGHRWRTILSVIRNQKHWCPKCVGCQKLTLEECQNLAKSLGGKCLSTEYINNRTMMKWKCKKGHEWQSPFHSVKDSKQWCSKCNMCPLCGLWRTYGKKCEYCKPKINNKKYQKTKEYKIVKYLREKIPDYDFIHNKSVGSHCTNGEKENSNGHLFLISDLNVVITI